jgi:hypothetical protein
LSDADHAELAGSERARKLAAYDKVAAQAQLLDIRLVSSKFSVKPRYYIVTEGDSEKDKASLKRGFTWNHSPILFEGGSLVGFFAWSVSVKKGNMKLLSAEATYYIGYTDVPDVEEEPALAFLARVGRIATYPYFRNYVAQMSWAAQAELPIMPVLRDIPTGRAASSQPNSDDAARTASAKASG